MSDERDTAARPGAKRGGGAASNGAATRRSGDPAPVGQAGTKEVAADETGTRTGSPRAKPREVGGPTGPEPTRFGDWERDGRCVDF